MDNLNTHSTASLYEAFEPEEARRLARRLEIHNTSKHEIRHKERQGNQALPSKNKWTRSF